MRPRLPVPLALWATIILLAGCTMWAERQEPARGDQAAATPALPAYGGVAGPTYPAYGGSMPPPFPAYGAGAPAYGAPIAGGGAAPGTGPVRER